MEMLVRTNLARQNHSQITSFWTRYTNLKKIPEYFEKKKRIESKCNGLTYHWIAASHIVYAHLDFLNGEVHFRLFHAQIR